MPYSIIVAEAAKDDIREAFLWYRGRREHLGFLFEADIDQAIESLKIYPYKNQIRYDNTRICMLRKFPYGIHFQIDEVRRVILVVAVFHNARNPQRWKRGV